MRAPLLVLGVVLALFLASACVDFPEVVVGMGGSSTTTATAAGGSSTTTATTAGGTGATGGSGGSAGGGGSGIVWPDSPTLFCTDGASVTDCPSAPPTQDGQVIGPLSFGSLEGASTRASETNFLWSSPQEVLTGTAESTCSNLAEGGLTWRVPTYPEFMSLMDLKGPNDVLFLNANFEWAVVNVPTSNVRGVDVGAFGLSSSSPGAVACIATPLFTPTFTNLGNGIWEQPESNLEWDMTPRVSTDWVGALGGCLAGWRLPTAKEGVLLFHHPLLTGLPFTLWTGSPSFDDFAFTISTSFRELQVAAATASLPSICVRPIP